MSRAPAPIQAILDEYEYDQAPSMEQARHLSSVTRALGLSNARIPVGSARCGAREWPTYGCGHARLHSQFRFYQCGEPKGHEGDHYDRAAMASWANDEAELAALGIKPSRLHDELMLALRSS